MLTKEEVHEVVREWIGKQVIKLNEEKYYVEVIGHVLGSRPDVQQLIRDAFVEVIRELIPVNSIGRRELS